MQKEHSATSFRQYQMLSMIRDKQEMKVEELAKLFHVSLVTVRRDLQYLEDMGFISRFHGGATVNTSLKSYLTDYGVADSRKLIAKKAASIVEDGDTIFINGSMTALNLLDYLGDKRVTVYTNNGNAVNTKYNPLITINCLGGTYKGMSHILTGDYAIRNLLETRVDKAFIGCVGISPSGEIISGIPSELVINMMMISHAREYYILADFSKMGKTSTYASVSLESSGTVITDEKAPQEIVRQLEDCGLKVIQVVAPEFDDENAGESDGSESKSRRDPRTRSRSNGSVAGRKAPTDPNRYQEAPKADTVPMEQN